MANIIGATFYHTGVTLCCDCAEKRLKASGLVLDEVKEVLGYQSDGFLTRKWNNWPIRYNHSNRVYDGQSYYVFVNDDNEYEYSSIRTIHRIDLSAFTEQDNDKLIYITHDKDNNAVANLTSSEGAYILTEREHYIQDSDYATISRVLAPTALTDLSRDIEIITDNDDFKGAMVLCDDCHTEIVEEATIDCEGDNCDTQLASGKVAYALEYGVSSVSFNGIPRSMRLCIDCYVEKRNEIERKIIEGLRKQYDFTHFLHFYADYAFKLVLDQDFDTLYVVERSRTEKTLDSVQASIARDVFVKLCEDVFFDVFTEELSKNTIMCHDAIDFLTDRFKND